MQFWLKAISNTVLFFAIFFAQILAINVFPFPFNRIDVVFIALWWHIFFSYDDRVWWMVVLLGLATELYSSSPFGLATISLFVSLLVGNWLLLHVFTSHAWHIVILSTTVALCLYHILFLALLLMHHSLYSIPWNVSGPFFASTGIGIALSVALMVFMYIFERIFNKRLEQSYTFK